MEANPLHARRFAQEEAYMRKLEAAQLRQIRAKSSRAQLRSELGGELEIDDEALLERLVELGIGPKTAPAFEALPLIEVAWADGGIDSRERRFVVSIATAFGLELGSPAHAQVELWLTRKPEPEFFEAWYRFAAVGLVRPAAAARALRVLEGSREIAESAGGLLGLGAVSRTEQAVIDRISHTLEGGLASRGSS